ncbi:MAG: nuclear transport factor 2 family protein, partial [Pseudomonas sagittaria]|nr:nuclear transport factor 2 family protein [Pseudomonas sagittaria]
MNLEARIARLEALEAIQRLKHRYLNACDLKQVESIRDCFAEGEILID